MKALGLRTCAYKVSKLEAGKEWFSRAFGIKPYFDEPYYVGFNIGGYELGLLPGESSPQAENVLTYWGVEKIQEAYDHFLSCGATEHEAPNPVGEELMVASVRDPWGNCIGLIYNPAFTLEK